MEKFFRIIDRISLWTGKGSSYLMVALVGAICYDITLRYIFAKPTFWAFELTYMIYGVYSMLGVAYCHYYKAHVRMDLIYARLSPRGKAMMDVICYIFLFFPLLLVLTYKSGEHGFWALTSGERSSVSVWRPYLSPFKLIITFGFAIFLLQGIVDFIRTLRIAIKGEAHEP